MEQLSRRIETSPRGALRFLISCWNRIVELSTFIATKLHLRCTAVEAELQSKSIAIESAMDGMAILDRDECYSYLNAAHARLYGYQSAEELLGKSWTVLYDEAELEWFKREVMPRLLQEGSVRVEAIGKRKDGTKFPQEVSLTLLPEGGLICVVRDISTRKRAQEELRLEALFARLNPSPVIRFGQDGGVLMANPAALEMLDIDVANPGVIQDLLPGFRETEVRECIERASLVQFTQHIADRCYQFVARGVPELGFGQVYGIDVSDLIAAEEKLQDSERFLHRVIDANPNPVYIKDVGGKIVFTNRAAAEVFGVAVEKLIGRSVNEFIGDAKEASDWEQQDRNVLVNLSEHFSPEERVVTSDGSERYYQVIKRPLIVKNGEAKHVIVAGADVTEVKSLQEQLVHSQKMEAVGQLAGGIAHDFNNLLTGIQGYCSLLKDKLAAGSEVSNTAGRIQQTAQRASELTGQLLGFARKGKHRHTSVDMHRVVDEVVSLLSRTLETNIQVQTHLESSLSVVQGDPVQMQQILLNLGINARDAILECESATSPGKLSIASRLVHFGAGVNEGSNGTQAPCIEISVSDSGVGIAPDLQERVFEPYFTTKPRGKGSGMGLAMVYGIVRNHGGSVSLSSKLGQGTTFKVYLPVTDEDASIEEELEYHHPVVGSGHILVVDDHDVIRDVAAEMLESLGYDVHTVADGLEALDYFADKEHDIDLILMDLMMPRIDGRECLRRIRKRNPDVRVVLSTGYGRNNQVQEVLDEGSIGFIQKPYEIHSLSRAVASAMQGS